ncbi:phosphoribosylaminoimidazole carboxylase ade2 [Serendipita sp. 396]|nr:phosphoribosylaminoimidazole carboxylase ade2 [Serendipita sp. 396]
MERKRVGLLGGGQLGRMLAYPAALLNIDLLILDPLSNAPAKQVINPCGSDEIRHLDGPFSDFDCVSQLAARVDLLTVEIEHVNVDALDSAKNGNKNRSVEVHPAPSTLRTIQDKYIQKRWLEQHGIALPSFQEVGSSEDAIKSAGSVFGYPFVLKSRTLAYDGRGNYVVQSEGDAKKALDALGAGLSIEEGKRRKLYAEKWVPFEREIAVMVIRGKDGEVRSYPPVETVHRDSICHLVYAPLRARDSKVLQRAKTLAESAVKTFEGAGAFGVEMFLMEDGSILVNEIAPRPHNSGHYTIEACECSQYENHLRAILGLPLGSTSMKVPSVVMLNLLGSPASSSLLSKSHPSVDEIARSTLSIPGATVHLYGKAESRPGRKMGHITIVGPSDAEVRNRLRPLLLQLGVDSKTAINDRLAPMSQHRYDHGTLTSGAFNSKNPLVGIIMGSDSDLPVMRDASKILDQFEIPYELTIVSAHRTPDRMVDYAKSAVSRGLRVIIAGAGGAAHLPGMVASMTALPVIGVPVKGSTLDGVDSLYSIVQMPRGIPVATVAINNATNAGLLAARIIGTSVASNMAGVKNYSHQLEQEVVRKVERLAEVGWEAYVIKK